MHVVHVIRDLNKSSGGPSRSVPAVCRNLASLNSIERITLLYRPSDDLIHLDDSSSCVFLPFNSDNVVIQLNSLHSQHPISIVHIHGLWTRSLSQSAKFSRCNSIPYLISPRGMLADWCIEHKRWRKKLAMLLYQKKDLQSAAVLHATSDQESLDISKYVNQSRIRVVPNGCDVPNLDWKSTEKSQNNRIAVSLGRLHPVKRYDQLIEAWSGVRPKGWKLQIAGPSENGYGEFLQAIINRLGMNDTISLVGPIDDDDKWDFFSKANLFVLTSASENFGMSIAEAMAAGMPVICTTGTPWSIIEEKQCGWWVGPNGAEIQDALRAATSVSIATLQRMGSRAKALISDRFSWASVSKEMTRVYQEIQRT